MIEFKSEWDYVLRGRGTVFFVKCDMERSRDNSGLTGETVKIDGREYVVKGVERYLPGSPIMRGETIGLLVDELP